MECIVLGDLATPFCNPPPHWPTSQVLCCYLILLGGEQRRRDPSVLTKKPRWLINKGGGWIRKLNHLWLLMSQPTDRCEILLIPCHFSLLHSLSRRDKRRTIFYFVLQPAFIYLFSMIREFSINNILVSSLSCSRTNGSFELSWPFWLILFSTFKWLFCSFWSSNTSGEKCHGF